jgi:hypothetical protein
MGSSPTTTAPKALRRPSMEGLRSRREENLNALRTQRCHGFDPQDQQARLEALHRACLQFLQLLVAGRQHPRSAARSRESSVAAGHKVTQQANRNLSGFNKQRCVAPISPLPGPPRVLDFSGVRVFSIVVLYNSAFFVVPVHPLSSLSIY